MPPGKLDLSIDRTEWNFGKYQCNILMISANFEGIGIPLYWSLLDNKSGASNTQNRCDPLEKVIKIVGVERIASIIGDREFIGEKWISRLQELGIPFCLRFPKNFKIKTPKGSWPPGKRIFEAFRRRRMLASNG